jgi:RNA polymerase sigma-70 factor (ECF subfamily)
MDSTQNQPEQSAAGPPLTLGDVLYSGGSSQALVSEKNWVRLADAVAAGDHSALHALYERTHRPVFTLMMRLTSNRETAEELTVDIFDDMWRKACRYDPSKGTVLGWIMNQARAKALDWLRLEQLQKGPQPASEGGLLIIDAPDYRDVMQFNEQSGRLRAALTLLTPEERAALEIGFFSELSYTEVATRLKQPASAIKARIRSALRKLATNAPLDTNPCDQAELASVYAIHALPKSQVAAVEAHLSLCWQCKRELESLRAVANSFVAWPTDLLRPAARLQERLARPNGPSDATPAAATRWSAPEWEDVAPGISCKLLATDTENHMVSMLVRLVPGGEYPPHTHAGLEELHLLAGELWIDDRKLHAGDYNRAAPGTGDKRVWSETGCACVLVTSTKDILS